MKPPTNRSEEFLRQYRRYGSGLSIGQFCARQGFAKQSIAVWQADIEGFAEALTAIQNQHDGSPHTTDAGLVKFGLTDDQSAFLAHYSEHRKRNLALDQVHWEPSDFMDAMKNPVFAREWEALRMRLSWAVEDSLEAKALDGSLGHQRVFLEAINPDTYSKKIKHTVSGQVRFTPQAMENRKAFWQERIGKALPAAPAEAEQEDIVDAEYVGAAN